MSFINPPPFGKAGDYSNLTDYALDSTLKIQWTGAPDYANLWLIKDGDDFTCLPLNLGKTFCALVLPAFHDSDSFSWPVQAYNSSYTTAIPFYYFIIAPTDNTTPRFYSHYFNILPQNLIPASSTTTTSATATISTATSSSGASLSAAATTTLAPSTASSTSTPSDSMSSGTKAAIGAAVGIGVPLIILLALIAFFLRRRNARRNSSEKQRPHRTSISPYYHNISAENNNSKVGEGRFNTQIQVIQEMPGSNQYSPQTSYRSELEASYAHH